MATIAGSGTWDGRIATESTPLPECGSAERLHDDDLALLADRSNRRAG